MFDEHARHGELPEYSVSNPHPGHGKDPNIMNELGHTHYPKWIEHPTEKAASGFAARVLVDNPDHEAEVMGAVKAKPKKGEDGWGK